MAHGFGKILLGLVYGFLAYLIMRWVFAARRERRR